MSHLVFTVLTFCFAGKTATGPCEFQSLVAPELGRFEVIYVPEEALGDGPLEKLFCDTLSRRSDDFLLLHLAGKGVVTPSGWLMHWVDAQGMERRDVPPLQKLVDIVDGCIAKSQVKDAHLEIDGALYDGAAFNGTGSRWPNGPNNPIISAFGPMGFDDRREDFDMALRTKHEKLAARAAARGKPDRWNVTVNDLPFVPDSSSVEPACRAFWKAILSRDLAAIVLHDAMALIPSAAGCRVVPEPLREDHERYVKRCAKADGENGKGYCASAFMWYRVALRQWATRGLDPEKIDDVRLLAEKLLWSAGPVPLGKMDEQEAFKGRVARRLLELRPTSYSALVSAIASAAYRHDWAGAEPLVDQALTLIPPEELATVPALWYVKTWGMEPGRLRALASKLERDPRPSVGAQGLYLHAYAENFSGNEGEARRLLHAALRREPESEDAREALERGRWPGLSMSPYVRPIVVLEELLK